MNIFSFTAHFDSEESCRNHFKAKVLDDHKADSTDETFQKSIDDEQTIVFTDKSTSYVNIADYVEMYLDEFSFRINCSI